MKEGQTIYAVLAADAPVSALVGTRIYPFDAVPQNPTRPYVTYQRIFGEPVVVLNDWGTPENIVEQIDCWADDHATVEDLATKVRTAIGANFAVGRISDGAFYEPDVDIARVSIDFSMWL